MIRSAWLASPVSALALAGATTLAAIVIDLVGGFGSLEADVVRVVRSLEPPTPDRDFGGLESGLEMVDDTPSICCPDAHVGGGWPLRACCLAEFRWPCSGWR